MAKEGFLEGELVDEAFSKGERATLDRRAGMGWGWGPAIASRENSRSKDVEK